MKKAILILLLLALPALAACGQTAPAAEAQQGEASVQVPNPWRDITEAEAKALCPGSLREPEDAEKAQWSVMEAEGEPPLVQLSFEWNGYSFTAREQVTNDRDADLSGMYCNWTVQTDMTLRNWEESAQSGTYLRFIGEDEWADVCTWYDGAKGISYSLSVTAKDLDGFDLRAVAEALAAPAKELPGSDPMTDRQALAAIRHYCCAVNQDLERIVLAGDYPVDWGIESCGEEEIVVLFRSYTGALIRYHIDPISGETHVTEFVPGISSEEQPGEESFNARAYLFSSGGIWQTASIVVEEDGTAHPEYYLRFTDGEILYGHLSDGSFVTDHADVISSREESTARGFTIRAKTADGVPYTFQTSESDPDVLEYFETWEEADFPAMYRGGASLSRFV